MKLTSASSSELSTSLLEGPTREPNVTHHPNAYAQRKKISLLSSRAMCMVALLGGERFVSGGWAKTGAANAIFESENGGAREKGQKQNETVSRAKRKRGRAKRGERARERTTLRAERRALRVVRVRQCAALHHVLRKLRESLRERCRGAHHG
jgi:hypothetical protein